MGMKAFHGFVSVMVFCGLLLLAGCSACSTQPSSPEQLRKETANATAELKNDTKAVAEGVRDGLRRPSAGKPLNLNTATQAQLTQLPGINDEEAARIVANRPYRTAHDLVDRKLITPAEYKQIAPEVTAQ